MYNNCRCEARRNFPLAHDFANVLGIIALNTEALRAQGSHPAAEQALETMARAVRNGRDLTDRLLAFARRRPLAVRPVRLDQWLPAARALLVQAAGPRIALEVEAPALLPEVLCDTSQLDTALVNLVINARDAMSGAGRIRVHAYARDSHVCLSVADEGPGMTDEVRRRALEPFYSTKGEAGTGLGLPQVYGFMRQLGGDLSIESAPGRGTRVVLRFPAAATESG